MYINDDLTAYIAWLLVGWGAIGSAGFRVKWRWDSRPIALYFEVPGRGGNALLRKYM